MTITEFLTARYDEDEVVARWATAGRWTVRPNGDSPWVTRADRPDVWLAITSPDPGSSKTANADHIARHNPAHVLADITAKRAIVSNMRTALDQSWQDSADTRVLVEHLATTVLCRLAQPYADHPDFDPTWRMS